MTRGEARATSDHPLTETPDRGGARRRTRTWAQASLGSALLLVVIAAAPPLLLGNYGLYLAALVCIYAIPVLGLGVLFGLAGQLSLAQATFFGLGAYTTALIAINTTWPPLTGLLVTLVVTSVAGVIVGLPALRVSGLRLALVTLAFGELFEWWLVQTPEVSGGEQGLFVPSLQVGPFNFFDPLSSYVLAALIAAGCSWYVWRLRRTASGRAMLAVRDSEVAARSVGVSLVRAKLNAFVLAGVLGGMGGWLFAHHVGAISPGFFNLFPSIYLLIAVILGGAGTVLGAWTGAAYIVLVPELFAQFGMSNAYPLIGGGVLIATVLLAPDGLASLGGGIAGAAGRLRRRISPEVNS